MRSVGHTTTQTTVLTQQEEDIKDMNAALRAFSYMTRDDVMSGYHRGCDEAYNAIDDTLNQSMFTRVEFRDDLEKCAQEMMGGARSEAEKRGSDRFVELGFSYNSATNVFRPAESDTPYPPGSGRQGHVSKVMECHRAAFYAYHDSHDRSSRFRDLLYDLSVVREDETVGPAGSPGEAKYISTSNLRKKNGVTLPILREKFEKVAKTCIDGLRDREQGGLKIEIRSSFTEEPSYLYVTSKKYRKLNDMLAGSYSVFNRTQSPLFPVKLATSADALETMRDETHHFRDKLATSHLEISDESIQKAISEATTGVISGGQVVLNGEEFEQGGVQFENGSSGCRALVLSIETQAQARSTMHTNREGAIPVTIVGVFVETRRARDGEPIVATMTFPITIIPHLLLDEAQVRASGISVSPYDRAEQMEFPAFRVVPSKFNTPTDYQAAKLETLDHDGKSGDPWTGYELYRPNDAVPITAIMVEFEDVMRLSVSSQVILARAAYLAISRLCKRASNQDSEKVRNHIRSRRIPSIGVGGMVRHPYMAYGDMKQYTPEHLLIRHIMCFLFACYLKTDVGKSPLYVHNQRRAAMAQLPPCVFDKAMLGWNVSGPITLMALECGRPKNGKRMRMDEKHESTLTRKIGKMTHNRNNVVHAHDASEFSFSPITPVTFPPVKYTIDEIADKPARPMTVNGHGELMSHDLTIVEMVFQLRNIKLLDKSSRGGEMVVWTPEYMIVVSYTKPDAMGDGESATAYLHSGPRVSRLAPSYHARKAVTGIEYSTLRVHYASLGLSGAEGYMEGLIAGFDAIKINLDGV